MTEFNNSHIHYRNNSNSIDNSNSTNNSNNNGSNNNNSTAYIVAVAATATSAGVPTEQASAQLQEYPRQFRLPFPWALYDMLNDAEKQGFSDIVSWNGDGTAFKVFNTSAFTERIVGRYFRQTKYKSFLRQLHLYGFDRIPKGPNKGFRMHELFRRNNRNLGAQMKPLKSRTRASTSRAMRRPTSRALTAAQSVLGDNDIRPLVHHTSIGAFSFADEMPSSEMLLSKMKNASMMQLNQLPKQQQQQQQHLPVVAAAAASDNNRNSNMMDNMESNNSSLSSIMEDDDIFDENALTFLDGDNDVFTSQQRQHNRGTTGRILPAIHTTCRSTSPQQSCSSGCSTTSSSSSTATTTTKPMSVASILNTPILGNLLQKMAPHRQQPQPATVPGQQQQQQQPLPTSLDRMLEAMRTRTS